MGSLNMFTSRRHQEATLGMTVLLAANVAPLVVTTFLDKDQVVVEVQADDISVEVSGLVVLMLEFLEINGIS